MSARNYWTTLRQRKISRRTMLGASAKAGVGAAGLALVGCGDDDDDAAPAAVDTSAIDAAAGDASAAASAAGEASAAASEASAAASEAAAAASQAADAADAAAALAAEAAESEDAANAAAAAEAAAAAAAQAADAASAAGDAAAAAVADAAAQAAEAAAQAARDAAAAVEAGTATAAAAQAAINAAAEAAAAAAAAAGEASAAAGAAAATAQETAEAAAETAAAAVAAAEEAAAAAQEAAESAAMAAEEDEAPATGGPMPGGRIIGADTSPPEEYPAQSGPFAGTGFHMAQWNIGLWDHLLRRRDGSGSDIEPRLAESWEQNGDATSTVLTLRQGIEFHNGKPIDAEAVKATFEAITNVDLSNNSQVRGLANVYLDSIEVTDNRTVVFDHPNWPGDVIFDMFQHAVMHDADEVESLVKFESYGGASGPFKFDFDQHKTGESYTVVRNENWYGEVLLDEIEMRTLPDVETRALALEAGEIDLGEVSADQYSRLGDMDHLSQMLGPTIGYDVLGPVQTHLGGGHPANDDPRFRLAMHKAIDRARLHVDVYQEIGAPAQQMWLPGADSYDPAFDTDPFDPEDAAALVEASGWAGVEMDIHVHPSVRTANAEIIQANLRDVGINANLLNTEVSIWVENFLAGTTPGCYMASTGFPHLAPESLMNINFQFRQPVNAVAAVVGEYPDIVDGLSSGPTPEERAALFNDWNELWAAGPWLIPFHTTVISYIVNNRVQGPIPWPAQLYAFTEEWSVNA